MITHHSTPEGGTTVIGHVGQYNHTIAELCRGCENPLLFWWLLIPIGTQ
ncbi:hypothetical protein AVEN_273118-1, partial [Araneus ventricosus]